MQKLNIPVLLGALLALAVMTKKAQAFYPINPDALAIHQNLDPQHWVPSDLLAEAVTYFEDHSSKFKNHDVITVIDYRPKSDAYRFFVIHMKTGEVERFHTAHGAGSTVNGDDDVAVQFGNIPDSNRSSLGFARTADVYIGKLQRSLRLVGLSSTNSNLLMRGIVVHGDPRMKEDDVIQPVSGGCPMLDFTVRDHVIDTIKNESLVYMGYSNGTP